MPQHACLISYIRSDLGRGVVTYICIRPVIVSGHNSVSLCCARYARVVIFVDFCTIKIQVPVTVTLGAYGAFATRPRSRVLLHRSRGPTTFQHSKGQNPIWFSGVPFVHGNNPLLVFILQAPVGNFASDTDSDSGAETIFEAAERAGDWRALGKQQFGCYDWFPDALW
jgi:hypothetical protein